MTVRGKEHLIAIVMVLISLTGIGLAGFNLAGIFGKEIFYGPDLISLGVALFMMIMTITRWSQHKLLDDITKKEYE